MAMYVHNKKDAEGCWWLHDTATSFPVWFTTSYRSSVVAGPHSVLAISSNKIAGNKTATTHPVSDLSSLVFSLPLDETISAQVKKITILLSFLLFIPIRSLYGFHL
jgi:hypothetical protein